MAKELEKNERRVLEEARDRSGRNPNNHVDAFHVMNAAGLSNSEFLDVFRSLKDRGLVFGEPEAFSRFNVTTAGIKQADTATPE